jgi:hypothetical protein
MPPRSVEDSKRDSGNSIVADNPHECANLHRKPRSLNSRSPGCGGERRRRGLSLEECFMRDRELACRLIHACRLAYDIPGDMAIVGAPFPDTPEINAEISAAGLVKNSLKIFQSPVENAINAFYYGETVQGEAVISFRGTLPPSLNLRDNLLRILLDWLNDFQAELVQGKGLAGRVHQGFLQSVDALWPYIQNLPLAAATGSGKPLILTGHSKGGALMYLAAYRLAAMGIPVAAAYSFAAPRTGDRDFARAFDRHPLLPNVCRYEYQDDIAPHVPPDTGRWINLKILKSLPLDEEIKRLIDRIERLPKSYASAGILQFIDWDDAIVGDSFALGFKRNLHLAELIAALQFVKIADDHSSEGGYTQVPCAPT